MATFRPSARNFVEHGMADGAQALYPKSCSAPSGGSSGSTSSGGCCCAAASVGFCSPAASVGCCGSTFVNMFQERWRGMVGIISHNQRIVVIHIIIIANPPFISKVHFNRRILTILCIQFRISFQDTNHQYSHSLPQHQQMQMTLLFFEQQMNFQQHHKTIHLPL
ncbi:hypothetical protein COLO4_25193 [Corchorus olitorius]|uniref:Uncharacterized protein n=1 Tax=Corchorus olitorius TaxID=93759 RepID=A0A1R3I4B1_9ROSI|nr:hypothetical protein COLO4_25193 [Corchorus olitorius]